MTIFYVLRASPFLGLAICLCLVTIGWCILVLRKGLHHTLDRYMIACIGLLSIYHALQILQSVGLLKLTKSPTLDNAVELIVTALYLLAGILLQSSSRHRVGVMFQLRLAESLPPQLQLASPSTRHEELFGPEIQVEMLRSSVTLLSDNAFKVYTYIWLHADRATGLLNGNESEIMRVLSKNRRSLLAAEHELISSGVCTARFKESKGSSDSPGLGALSLWKQARTLCSASSAPGAATQLDKPIPALVTAPSEPIDSALV